MKLKKFKDLTDEQLNMLINVHYNHWKKYSEFITEENTSQKFKNLYTTDNLPLGLALFNEENNIVGFCVLKIENLKLYPEIYPWLSDVMILKEYRNLGYGRILVNEALKYLKTLGYDKVYVWTDQAPLFYEKLNFKFVQKVEKNNGGYGKLYSKEGI